jgi:RimJ/RimL family protein N-acetyltransferase
VEIDTERLRLRPMRMADLDEYLEMHDDPEVTRFVERRDRQGSVERLRADEREWRERGHGMFAVLDRASGRFLGRVILKHWPQFEETELGWTLRRDAWGHGYATEAAAAVRDWGFANLDLPYLTSMVHPDNEASARLARRLGMSELRTDVLLDTPVVVYWLSREQWAGCRRSYADRS